MVVEATLVPTQSAGGRLRLTGQLGSVMKESAELAMTWVSSNTTLLGLEEGGGLGAGRDIHLHFPAGAVEKDGPSAGVTIATALASLLTGRTVREGMVGRRWELYTV